MNLAGVSGIVTGEAPVSYWPVFPPIPRDSPRSLCDPVPLFFFLSGEFATRRFAATIFNVTQCCNIVATLFRMVTTLGPFIRGKIRRVLNKTRTGPFIRACLI